MTEEANIAERWGGVRPTEAEIERLYAQPVLKKGDKGELVKGLQQILGVEDSGIFDDETESILMSFQQVFGLKVDGIAGPEVWWKLLRRN